jgi:hypothetical protein
VSSIDQLKSEPGADRTARPGDEDLHRRSPFVTSAAFRGSTCMTRLAGGT